MQKQYDALRKCAAAGLRLAAAQTPRMLDAQNPMISKRHHRLCIFLGRMQPSGRGDHRPSFGSQQVVAAAKHGLGIDADRCLFGNSSDYAESHNFEKEFKDRGRARVKSNLDLLRGIKSTSMGVRFSIGLLVVRCSAEIGWALGEGKKSRGSFLKIRQRNWTGQRLRASHSPMENPQAQLSAIGISVKQLVQRRPCARGGPDRTRNLPWQARQGRSLGFGEHGHDGARRPP